VGEVQQVLVEQDEHPSNAEKENPAHEGQQDPKEGRSQSAGEEEQQLPTEAEEQRPTRWREQLMMEQAREPPQGGGGRRSPAPPSDGASAPAPGCKQAPVPRGEQTGEASTTLAHATETGAAPLRAVRRLSADGK